MDNNRAIATLQAQILDAVLARREMSGAKHRVTLPDLQFVLNQDAICVSAKNLAGSLDLPTVNKPIRVLTPENLLRKAESAKNFAYLEFSEPVEADDRVRMNLSVRMARPGVRRESVGLSSLLLEFRRDGEAWVLVSDPARLAD